MSVRNGKRLTRPQLRRSLSLSRKARERPGAVVMHRKQEAAAVRENLRRGFALLLLIILLGTLSVAASDCVAGVYRAESGCEFTYEDPGAATVSLVGSFNGWNQSATPMLRDEKGVWKVTVSLGPGKHEYKFVVNGSDWIADPENAVTVGEYGNSGIEIDSEGEIVVSAGPSTFSNTTLSSRVALNGNFRATYSSESNVAGDVKLRLQRPEHEFNLDVNIKANESVMGSGRIQFDTSLGDVNETTGRLYSGHLDLLTSAFDLRAYYNEEVLDLGEPLELLGHEDLRGTIEEEHLEYGRGTQGAVIKMRGFDIDALMLYTNVYDYDRFNDPSVYDNCDTDVMGARLTRDFKNGDVQLGISWLREQNGWWVGFATGTNESAVIDSFVDATGSESDWFEVGTADQTFAGDLRFELPGQTLGWLEYAWWNWSAKWDVGNSERYEGVNKVNGKIDVPVGDDSGYRLKALLEGKQGDRFSWALSHELQRCDAMDAGELYVDFRRPGFADPSTNEFVEVNGISGLSIHEFAPLPERKNDITEFDLSFRIKNLKADLEVDRTGMTREYCVASEVSPTVPSTQTNVQWRVAPDASLGLFGGRLVLAVQYEYVQNDPGGDFFLSFPVSDTYDAAYGVQFYNTRELVLSGRLGLTDEFAAVWNLRRMTYWANEGQVSADENGYTSPYFALVYTPSRSIELRLGYHVNPTYYNDAPVEGRENGRQVWRDIYMWAHGGSVFDAERALSDVRMVTLMGVIRF